VNLPSNLCRCCYLVHPDFGLRKDSYARQENAGHACIASSASGGVSQASCPDDIVCGVFGLPRVDNTVEICHVERPGAGGAPQKPKQAREAKSAIAERQANENALLSIEEAIAFMNRMRNELRPKRNWLMR
jgi:hypothetical protein